MPKSCRCGSAAITLLLVLTAPLPAQERRPVVALTGGLGNTLGGLGAGVDYYLARSRVSLSAGVGYWTEPIILLSLGYTWQR